MREKNKGDAPSVYEYKEFKDYFSAYLDWLKSQGSKYSLRWIAKRLDLKSHAYLIRIADGSKIPTAEFVGKLITFFELDAEESNYLRLLLAAQNAKTIDQKDFILSKTKNVHREVPATNLESKTFDMISNWYLVTLLELSMIDGFQDDPAWIAKRLRNAISEDLARKALEKLEEVELLKRDEDGKLRRNVSGLLVESRSPSQSIRNFHRQMLSLADKTLDDVPQNQRLFLSQTFRVAPERMAEAEELIVEFRRRFQVLMAGGEEKEVYHLAIQFFPLTSPVDPS